jgi:hypothetical protein
MSLAMHTPSEPLLTLVSDAGRRIDVYTNTDIRFPVSVPRAGVCVVELRTWPDVESTNRWFLWLTDEHDKAISDVRWFEPMDDAAGPRRMRFCFRCTEAADRAFIRVWADPGGKLQVSDVRFGTVAPSSTEDSGVGPYRLVGEFADGVRLFELSDPAGIAARRMRWAPRVTPVGGVVEAVERLRFEPDAIGLPDGVVIENPDDVSASSLVAGTVRVIEDRPGYAVCDVEGGAGFVVFNEAYDPGWAATIDGTRVPVLRANAVLQAVRVPAGSHRVVFRYWPLHLTVGIGVSCVGVLVLLGVVVRTRPNRRPCRT